MVFFACINIITAFTCGRSCDVCAISSGDLFVVITEHARSEPAWTNDMHTNRESR
jgi:hypothetical protein